MPCPKTAWSVSSRVERTRPGLTRWSLAGEALIWLAFARLTVTLLPFSLAARLFGLTEYRQGIAEGDAAPAADDIAWAIAAAAPRTPWPSTCLVRALAGAAMLRRRRLSGVVILGVARNAQAGKGMKAHAWLSSGATILTGADLHESYTPVATFTTISAR